MLYALALALWHLLPCALSTGRTTTVSAAKVLLTRTLLAGYSVRPEIFVRLQNRHGGVCNGHRGSAPQGRLKPRGSQGRAARAGADSSSGKLQRHLPAETAAPIPSPGRSESLGCIRQDCRFSLVSQSARGLLTWVPSPDGRSEELIHELSGSAQV